MAADKKGAPALKSFEFRGREFQVDPAAARSMRVQRDLALVDTPGHQEAGWRSYDLLFGGRLDEYLDEIPGEDGEVGRYGCTDEDFVAFVRAAVEAVKAKN